jgi:hypothetical protein
VSRTQVVLAALISHGLVGGGGGGCSELQGDPPAPYEPHPLGSGLRIADVQDPKSPSHAPNTNVNLTSLDVLWVDAFDETKDGKSLGTVFVEDVGSTAPYSALSVYQPSYVPSELRLLPGDVLDFVGPYQEVTSIGSAHFSPGQTLPQLAKPVGTFRYEYQVPAPRQIALADLDDYGTGRAWEGMLVTVSDVYAIAATSSGGRVTYTLAAALDASTNVNTVSMSNEEYDLQSTDFPPGTHFKSVTGLVTWFFSYHIAPRSPSDLAQ